MVITVFSFCFLGQTLVCPEKGADHKAERKERSGKMEDFKIIENYLMVKMPKEVDHHKSIDISKTADELILSGNVENVVFDFEDTRFMDSSGIGIIMGRYKKITCFGGKVYTINTDERIKRTLMISGLHKMIEIME